MKRILKMIGIGIIACLGLSILVGIMNAITGTTPATTRITPSPIVVGLLQKPTVNPTSPPVVEAVATATTAPPTTAPEPTAMPVATDSPTSAPVEPTMAPVTEGVTVTPIGDAINIRSGPSVDAAAVGTLTSGQSAKVIGRLADGTWLQIEQGWVNAGVVAATGALDQVAIVEAPAIPATAPVVEASPATAAPIVEAPAPTLAAPVADVPASGGNTDNLVEPSADEHPCPAGLPIKGNINSKNERIYHSPGQQAYNRTDPEQCFATSQEAQAADYRAALR